MSGSSRPVRSRLLACALAALLGLPAVSAAADAPDTAQARPTWLEGAVIYAVVPPLFGAEQPFRSVMGRLDALQDLGVDALWFSPINATDDLSAISYAVTDYFSLRSDFGTPDDFRALVRAAKSRGMRVLMDFVPNHSSTGHPFYQDALLRGPASPFFGFYDRDPSGEATHYFNWEHLKNLEFDHPDVQRMMIAAFSHWIREYDVDGFRVDAAWGIRQRNPEFWARLVSELRQIKPDVFLLAEASAHDPFYVRNGFDSAYDWTGELGKWAWERVFDDPRQIAARLDAALSATHGKTPADQVTRFLNNNDTGERFITRHGVDAARLATILLLTLPGIPVIYTGDEVGAEYEPYADPPPVVWKDRHGLLALHRTLTHLRGSSPALARGGFERLETRAHPSAYAFARADGQDLAVVAVNFGDAAAVLELSPSASIARGLAKGDAQGWVDALTGAPVELTREGKGRWSLALSPGSGVVLVPRQAQISATAS